MGETATDTRREIEATRDELGDTVQELRSRTGRLRKQAARVGLVAVGVFGAAAAVVGSLMLLRRQRGGKLTRVARRLPDVTRPTALPLARNTERWLERRSKRAAKEREQFMEALSARITERQAEAQRRANPLWRKTAAKALETAAAVGTAALIRRAMSAPGRGMQLSRDQEFNPGAEPERALAGERSQEHRTASPRPIEVMPGDGT